MARASGITRDLRKYTPYDNYNLLYFNIPVLSKGDC